MRAPALTFLLFLTCQPQSPHSTPSPGATGPFLFVWAGDADKKESDFLAVIDANPASTRYGAVVATLPVGVVGTSPHHTEHEMPAGGVLWANGFDASRTFRFDLRDPTHPRMLAPAADPPLYRHPHSYARLPNGNLLVTYQYQTAGGSEGTGGLVEFDTTGQVVRSASAVAASDSGIRPYSLLVLPLIDRVITTATDMHLQTRSRSVQVWRLSDLALLHTLVLPPGPRGDASAMSAEPRLLADGRTVMVNTFTCGLYRLHGLEGSVPPTAEWVYSTPWERPPFCALPLVVGDKWIQTMGPEHAIATLDVSEPSQPREMSRLTLGQDDVPHWIALEPGGRRIVITGYRGLQSRVLIANLDVTTGALTVDTTFRSAGATQPGVDFARDLWPHGPSGRAIPHGAVFSRP